MNISQISTVDKRRLIQKLSTLNYQLVQEINYGLKLILNIY